MPPEFAHRIRLNHIFLPIYTFIHYKINKTIQNAEKKWELECVKLTFAYEQTLVLGIKSIIVLIQNKKTF